MTQTDFRLPAEWEPQSATLLAWPHAASDWAERLDGIHEEYVALIRAIAARQPVVLLVMPGDASAAHELASLANVHRLELPFDDTWCRDYGPMTLINHAGHRRALDCLFTGWGGKYPAARDNRVNTLLARQPLFSRLPFRQNLFELEGGAIECDGNGTLLINWHCLRTRHAHLSRDEIAFELRTLLGVERVIGIDIEPLPGDDTDGHIDTLARFLAPGILVYQQQSDETRDRRLKSQLEALRRVDGQPYRLLALPCPDGVDPALPANYVNFVFVNGACLVPAYGGRADEQACARLRNALPNHAVESVPAAVLISQYGGPHCASMHIPKGRP